MLQMSASGSFIVLCVSLFLARYLWLVNYVDHVWTQTRDSFCDDEVNGSLVKRVLQHKN